LNEDTLKGLKRSISGSFTSLGTVPLGAISHHGEII
jgi:hypothetical protein